MRTVLICIMLAAISACAPSKPPVARLQTEGQDVVMVRSQSFEVFRRGVRESTGRIIEEPAIWTIAFDFICLRDFQGGSPQERANASLQYSRFRSEKEWRSFDNPRVRGWEKTKIRESSVQAQGCDPESIQKLGSNTDSRQVLIFALTNGLLRSPR